MFEYFSSFIL